MPTFSISLVLIDFCEFTNLSAGGSFLPSKYGFNVATPELIHNKLGSSTGTKLTDSKKW